MQCKKGLLPKTPYNIPFIAIPFGLVISILKQELEEMIV
jgi:hypothetical protein